MAKTPIRLIEKINNIPEKPGIYRMIDAEGNIIYIGKSKNLKARVKSYFSTEHQWSKLKRLVFNIDDVNYIVTETELEAKILECSLIKKIQPIYNSQFKNENKYKYLKLDKLNQIRPMIMINEREGDNCFGPYRSKSILESLIKLMDNIYPILKFGSSYSFEYMAIPKQMTKEEHFNSFHCLLEILSKENCMKEFLSQVENMMTKAASDYLFERASYYRDLLKCTECLYRWNFQHVNITNSNKVVLGIRIQDGYKLFYISRDRLILKRKLVDISYKTVDQFLIDGSTREVDFHQVKDEKSNLDYQGIMRSEVEENSSKAVLTLGDIYSIDEFIARLKKLQ